MESIRNVVSQLDPSNRPTLHVFCVQDGKLSVVGLRDVELDDKVAIVLLTLLTAVPAKTRDKDRLTNAAMGVPHLPVLPSGVKLGRGMNTFTALLKCVVTISQQCVTIGTCQ